MNLIVIKGRLVRDPELKNTQSGKSVCNATVAVDRAYSKNGEKEADFFDCVFWEKAAEFVSKYFHKGQEILVQGEMQSRKYQDKNGNNRTAWEVKRARAEFCGPKADREPDVQPPAQTYAAPSYSAGNADDFAVIEDNDDLSF